MPAPVENVTIFDGDEVVAERVVLIHGPGYAASHETIKWEGTFRSQHPIPLVTEKQYRVVIPGHEEGHVVIKGSDSDREFRFYGLGQAPQPVSNAT